MNNGLKKIYQKYNRAKMTNIVKLKTKVTKPILKEFPINLVYIDVTHKSKYDIQRLLDENKRIKVSLECILDKEEWNDDDVSIQFAGYCKKAKLTVVKK